MQQSCSNTGLELWYWSKGARENPPTPPHLSRQLQASASPAALLAGPGTVPAQTWWCWGMDPGLRLHGLHCTLWWSRQSRASVFCFWLRMLSPPPPPHPLADPGLAARPGLDLHLLSTASLSWTPPPPFLLSPTRPRRPRRAVPSPHPPCSAAAGPHGALPWPFCRPPLPLRPACTALRAPCPPCAFLPILWPVSTCPGDALPLPLPPHTWGRAQGTGVDRRARDKLHYTANNWIVLLFIFETCTWQSISKKKKLYLSSVMHLGIILHIISNKRY